MLQQYHSELGEEPLYENSASYNPFIKKWVVRTHEVLSGPGITFWQNESGGKKRKCYHVTERAFEKLCEDMDISQNLLFD